jgi:phosphodiesterase/alkaline phosphatase D-like protein
MQTLERWTAVAVMLIAAPIGSAVLSAAPPDPPASRTAATPEDEQHVTHGPILGRISTRGVGVWARTAAEGEFQVRYGTSPDNLDRVSEPIPTRLEHDNTGWGLIEDLEPGTEYHYELAIPGQPGRTGRGGRFRTLPDGDDYRDPELNPAGLFNFKFEYACGNNQNPGHSSGPALPAFRTMLKTGVPRQIDFAILNGDWLYESQREYSPEQWLAQVGHAGEEPPHTVRVAPTIVGVWQNYKHFLSQAEPLERWHANVPSFFTFDDHEMLNDVWGAGTPGLRDRRAVFRDIGTRAWYDYLGWSNPTPFTQPIHFGLAELEQDSDVLTDPRADFTKLDLEQANNLHVHWGTPTAGVNVNALDGVGGDPNAGVYEIVEVLGPHRLKVAPPADADGTASYSIGRRSYWKQRIANCEFFFTDTRSQREMHDTARPDKPGLSVLGKQQREWLMEGTKASDADFLFVVSSVNFMVPHVGGGAVVTTNKDDAWTVFLDEREKLIEHFDSLKQPVCVLTGDLHNSFVIQITDNVWEFASGPHNSNNHWATDEGNRPPNGRFQYGPRPVEIRWSTYFRGDIPRDQLLHPNYCVVQVNNVFNNPQQLGGKPRWVAFPRPQVVFQYYDGRTGELRYAESLLAAPKE